MFVDFTVARNGLLAISVGPDIVPTTTSEKAPATLGQALFQIAPLYRQSVHRYVCENSFVARRPTRPLHRTPTAALRRSKLCHHRVAVGAGERHAVRLSTRANTRNTSVRVSSLCGYSGRPLRRSGFANRRVLAYSSGMSARATRVLSCVQGRLATMRACSVWGGGARRMSRRNSAKLGACQPNLPLHLTRRPCAAANAVVAAPRVSL